MTLRVRNWTKYQHYGNRTPDWIKLHVKLLGDPDWHELDPLAAKVLVGILLIASESGGTLPDNRKLAFRLRISQKELDAIIPQLNHWFEEVASNGLAPCLPMARADKELEVRVTEANASVLTELSKVLDVEHSKAVIAHRRAMGKRATLTPHAAKLLARKFAECPDPNAAADTMIANGWQGFDASWVENARRRNGVGNGTKRSTLMEAGFDLIREAEENEKRRGAALPSGQLKIGDRRDSERPESGRGRGG